jgi:hypothetical protein
MAAEVEIDGKKIILEDGDYFDERLAARLGLKKEEMAVLGLITRDSHTTLGLLNGRTITMGPRGLVGHFSGIGENGAPLQTYRHRQGVEPKKLSSVS